MPFTTNVNYIIEEEFSPTCGLGVKDLSFFKSGTNIVLSTITNGSPSYKLLKMFLKWPCEEGGHLPIDKYTDCFINDNITSDNIFILNGLIQRF